MSQIAPVPDQAPRPPCSEAAIREFVEGVNTQLWRSNALMVANAVLVAIMEAAGASGRRYGYRHASVTRLLFLGASTLYLPIISYVASSIGKESCSTSGLDVYCHGRSYVSLVLIWTVLVQIIGTNTSAIVAADDYHGGPKIGPSIELLARTVWTSYLVFYYAGRHFLTMINKNHLVEGESHYYKMVSRFLIVLCLLSLSKIMLKLYAYHKAKRSFTLGRNSRLIAGYMVETLQGDALPRGSSPGHDQSLVLPLIVMGEDKQEIEETPHGYTIRQRNSRLVTLDMVWQMVSAGDALLTSQPWLKDLCLSFSLFKLLRLRFGNTPLAESGSAKAFSFVSDALLNNGNDPARVFDVIADEISFVLDSYYSSLPTSYFGRLVPVLNITVSLSIVAWCLGGATFISHHYTVDRHPHQIFCSPNPMSCTFPNHKRIVFGNLLFNALPTFSLFVAVILAEAWEIASYLCSNWVKVTLLCNYINHASWQQSPRVQRGLDLVMKLGFRRSWSDRYQMGQMSLLLTGQGLMRRVQVSPEVKAAIVDALRRSNGGALSKCTAALGESRIGGDILWACQGQGTSDVILVWHIATGILDAGSHGGGADASSTSSRSAGKRAVATRLSRYCAYLVAAAPELLPDDTAWSKKLHGAVSRDIKLALAGEPAAEHDAAIAARLGERCEHEVVKRGVRLGKQLLELQVPDEEARWGLLAGFWCEILLYAAPSDNLKAHKKAIARGTELVTLVWALLTHAGIVTRPKNP
ncbi:uncharacterized protein LOC120643940 [Panicum virgatum]|uniref:DUF4220 domain-containing protein n=1 Tax=Panicum virgatum TaxID=38727 RepID=A0A8T0PHD6_PANVG|nr:uncharacterized protein LOC120643940 [Panicum virgatum]KAG2561000.1 hypothetical protein PVAP13_8KG003600 [Panicum virgatum]